MRDYQDRNHDDQDDHLEENQRIGKRIAQENRHQNPQNEYRSGRDYHNQPQPGNQGRQHYGADPNSAYRNSNINYGDGRDHRNNQPERRNDQWGNQDNHNQYNQQYSQRNQQNQNSWPRDRGQEQWNRDNRHPQDGHYHHGDQYQNNRNNNQNYNRNNNQDNNRREDENRFNQSDNQFYEGQPPRMFDDRKHFQAEDYRYGSGRRQWESPGHDDDHNDRNDNRNHQERGFFGRIADEIREDWRTFTHPEDYRTEDQNQQPNQNRNQGQSNSQDLANRKFNRGYESGPRWADEDDSRRQNNDRRRHRDDDYNRY